MKTSVAILAAVVGLSGCAGWPTARDGSSDSVARRGGQCPVVLPAIDPAEGAGQVETLLRFRQEQCSRPRREWLARLETAQRGTSDGAVLRTLMLATCAPDQTPGVLANALVSARKIDSKPPALDALLALLSAEAESYALLERRLQATQKKLDDTIQGIRNIESEMEASSESMGREP